MLTAKTEYISVEKAAKIIGCTQPHVRKLLDEKVLVGTKLNERAWAVEKWSAVEYAETPQKTGRPRSRP